MCFVIPKQKTIEEIIAGNSASMTDDQKAEYRYELDHQMFALLSKVDVTVMDVPGPWDTIAKLYYPSMDNVVIPDILFRSVSLQDLATILKADWVSNIKYVTDTWDCDKFALELYLHLCRYYNVNSVLPVWGMTGSGYHGFNMAIVKDGDRWIARLVEPQTDAIFETFGPLGQYIPDKVVDFLALIKE